MHKWTAEFLVFGLASVLTFGLSAAESEEVLPSLEKTSGRSESGRSKDDERGENRRDRTRDRGWQDSLRGRSVL